MNWGYDERTMQSMKDFYASQERTPDKDKTIKDRLIYQQGLKIADLEAQLAEANEKLKKVETELVKTNELNGFLQDRIRELLKVENTRLCIYCQTRIPSIDEYGEYQQVCKKCFKRFHEGL